MNMITNAKQTGHIPCVSNGTIRSRKRKQCRLGKAKRKVLKINHTAVYSSQFDKNRYTYMYARSIMNNLEAV